jgi:hypothetical protein
MAVKYSSIFHSKALQNLPKLGFLVWKQTIWQPWSAPSFFWSRQGWIFAWYQRIYAERLQNSFHSKDFNKQRFVERSSTIECSRQPPPPRSVNELEL